MSRVVRLAQPHVDKHRSVQASARVRPRSRASDCAACNGSGVRAWGCDSFAGAYMVPCEQCGGRRPALLQDKAFLVQMAVSTTIAAGTMAWIMLFA